MKVRLLLVPYDTALRDWRCGAGPHRLLEEGLEDRLRELNIDIAGVDVMEDGPDRPPAEIRTAFELMRRLAMAVRRARDAGEFPLVLSGNCNAAAGVLSGLTPAPRYVCWFDAHADFNTPDTTSSGFLDGMALSVALGQCWTSLAGSVPGFRPVHAARTCLLGARDFDPLEEPMLQEAGVTLIRPADITKQPMCPFPADRPPVGTLGYLHLDLDVLDPDRVGRANPHASAGGVSTAELIDAIRDIRARLPIAAAAVTSWAPECDVGGRVGQAALQAIEAIVTPRSSALRDA